MTAAAPEVLRRLAEWLLAADPEAQGWASPSACDGWTNDDLLVHLACTLRELVEPAALPPLVAGDIEATNEVQVEALRGPGTASLLSEYARLLPAALEAVEELQAPALANETFSLEDAGVYPVHLSADALVFDHFCHLVHDVTAAGALPGIDPDLRRDSLAVSTGWLVAGLGQMSGEKLAAALEVPVGLILRGPGGGLWSLSTAPDGSVVTRPAERVPVTALESSTEDFMLWGTLRSTWSASGVSLLGDRRRAAAVASAIHVF